MSWPAVHTQWGDANGDGGSGGGDAPSGERPRLKLTKRSEAGVRAAQAKSGGAKSNPFGNAKPREEVLLSKGVDALALEKRMDAKTRRLPRMSKEEEEEYEKDTCSLRSNVCSCSA